MITKKQRKERRQHIGSSDAAAIVGLDPWKTAMDVYLSKVHPSDETTNPAMEAGNVAEPGLLSWWKSRHAKKVERGVTWRSPDYGTDHCAANLDGYHGYGENIEIIECKSTGDTRMWQDEVPAHVLAQVAHQLYCVRRAKVAWVVVFMAGRGVNEYRLDRDNVPWQKVGEACKRFWDEHVARKIPPGGEASMDTLKSIARTPGKFAPVAVEDIIALENLRKMRLAIEKLEDKAMAKVVAQLEDAEADLQGNLTYMEVSRRSFDLDRLRQDYPELADEYMRDKKYRKLSIKPLDGLREIDAEQMKKLLGL
jgi:putative phage-type endonuclease